MLEIKYLDDGKEKWQSHEMKIINSKYCKGIMQYETFYGEDKKDVLEQLKESIKKTIKDLEELLKVDINNIKESNTRKNFDGDEDGQ